MSRKARMLKGSSLLTLTEIVSRFFPLFVIRQTRSALGVDDFGESQFLLNTIDILIQFVGPGYGTLAALDVARNPRDKAHVGKVASVCIAIRLLHAAIILMAMIPLSHAIAPQSRAAFMALAALAMMVVFEMEFLHASLQRMQA